VFKSAYFGAFYIIKSIYRGPAPTPIYWERVQDFLHTRAVVRWGAEYDRVCGGAPAPLPNKGWLHPFPA